MRVIVACKVFANNSVKLVLLVNGNSWYEVDSNTRFLACKALYPFEVLPTSTLSFSGTQLYL